MVEMDAAKPPWQTRQIAIVVWGVGGVLLLLAQAIWRLSQVALEPLHDGMTSFQLALYVGWMIINAYAEGYRGFQLRFSPRVVARAVHLARHPRALHVALAPLFCMSFFHATRRARLAAWGVSLGVLTAIMLIRHVAQPWRGIIDAGVVVGLGWGAATLVVFTARVFAGLLPRADAQLPERTLSNNAAPLRP